MAEPDAMLVARNVTKSYGGEGVAVNALRGIDLDVMRSEFVAIMGPSGCGKTTLLNCLSGLDAIDGGSILLDGQALEQMSDKQRTTYRAESMGFVFQAFNLVPVFTAVENVELPLLLAGASASKARRRAEEMLDRVGLIHRTKHRPTQLSGGEQQRVAIARALAGSPKLVWADEPTGALDSENAASVMKLLCELNADGLTLILVTHEPTIGAMANRIVTLRDGQIVADVRPEARINREPPGSSRAAASGG